MTTVSEARPASTLQLFGDMDISREAAVTRTVAAATAASHATATALTIDLSGVTFLDCSGLRPLLEARNRLGGLLWLDRPAPAVSRLLDLTRLAHTFQLRS